MKIRKFKIIKNSSCDLIYFNSIKNFIQKAERVFFLISHRSCQRGNHAHKKCTQYIYSLSTKIHLTLDNGTGDKKIILKYGEILKVEPLIWIKIQLKKNQIVGVFSDKKYSKDDYIRNYKQFHNLIKKNKPRLK